MRLYVALSFIIAPFALFIACSPSDTNNGDLNANSGGPDGATVDDGGVTILPDGATVIDGAVVDPKRLACDAMAEAYCQRTLYCSKASLNWRTTNVMPDVQMETCLSSNRLRCDQLLVQGSPATESNMRTCATAWSKAPCEDMRWNTSLSMLEQTGELNATAAFRPAECRWYGSGAPGIACVSSAQCSSGSCNVEGDAGCGKCKTSVADGGGCASPGTVCAGDLGCFYEVAGPTCTPYIFPLTQRVAVGAACPDVASGKECPAEAPCQYASDTDPTGTCRLLPKDGEVCGMRARGLLPDLCALGTACFRADAGSREPGVCKTGGNGLPCSAGGVCPRGLWCKTFTDRRDTCVPGTTSPLGGKCNRNGSEQCDDTSFCYVKGVCKLLGQDAGSGQACDAVAVCPSNEFCSAPNEGICNLRAKIGEKCGGSSMCPVGATCSQQTRTCIRTNLGQGAACDAAQGLYCSSPYQCIAGSCSVPVCK